MKQITLWKRGDRKTGFYALVDDKNYELVSKYDWYMIRRGKLKHALTYPNKGKDTLYMHQLILPNSNPKLEVDHINGDGLDNQEENLRLATRSQQRGNQLARFDSASGYKGVEWFKRDKCWKAYIVHNYTKLHLGYFSNKESAALAYNEAAIKYFGEFARLNIVN